jgi:hypothetical protein
MKQKDIVMLVVAVGILLGAGYLAYTQLLPKKSSGPKTVQVEKVGVLPTDMDATGKSWLSDTAHVHDYDSPVDLTGLGNPSPFTPQ